MNETQQLPVTGMSCAGCATAIENSINRLDGIDTVEANLANETVYFSIDADKLDVEQVATQIRKAGYGVITNAKPGEDLAQTAREADFRAQSLKLWIGLAFTLPLFLLSMGRDFALLGDWAHATWVNWLFLALATPVQFYTGADYYRGAFNSLRFRAANMDVLVVLGSSVAYFYSLAILLGAPGEHVYFEAAAAIITLIKVGKVLEARAKGKTGAALRALLDLQAKTARVLRDGEEVEVPISAVKPGSILIVKPGEKIPTDGVVLGGSASVDESLMTGESMPVTKKLGHLVIGATINLDGQLKMAANKVGKDTSLAQIIRQVETAQGSKAPVQRLADKVAAVFVPIIVAIALLSFSMWYVVIGADFQTALLYLVAILVIACPCALGLATPTAIVTGMGEAAKKGILFRNSAALEQVHRLSAVVFDKTGTLTQGKPVLTDVIVNAGERKEILRLAASIEQASTHPLAIAIVQAAKAENIELAAVENFQSVSGKGVKGQIDGQQVVLGTTDFINGSFTEPVEVNSELAAEFESLQQQARTALWLALDGEVVAVLGIADSLKDGAKAVVAQLKQHGLTVALLTGDNRHTAAAIAAEVGIDMVFADVLPGEKASKIKALQAKMGKVAMVGDGINDAPALAQADVGIALGTGADVAKETADITLMHGDIHTVSEAIHISEMTLRVIKQNLFWAFAYNVALIPVAAGALAIFTALPGWLHQLHPAMAALAMSLSSIMVVGNSLRLARKI
jgi:Cu+-exporting ATPase